MDKDKCAMCKRRKLHTAALVYCHDCREPLCETCRDYHDAAVTSSHHHVTRIDGRNGSLSPTVNLSSVEICPRHFEERISYFCNDHNTLCCNTCGFLEHRKCNKVTPLDELLETFDIGGKSKEVGNNIVILTKHLKQILGKIAQNVSTLTHDKNIILQEVRSLRINIDNKLRALEKDIISFTEGNHKSEELDMQSQTQRGNQFMHDIVNDSKQLNLVMTYGSNMQKFITLHKLERNQERYAEAIVDYQVIVQDVSMKFTVDKIFHDLIQTIKSFGKITVRRTKLSTESFPQCPPLTITPIRSAGRVRPMHTPLCERKAVKVAEFNARINEDSTECHISDFLHLSDSRLLLVDNANSNIKIFGKDKKCETSLKMRSRPWNVTQISTSDVAVTMPREKVIQIVEAKENLILTRGIRTRLKCWDITSINDKLIITTGSDDHCVLILDMTGTELRTIRPPDFIRDKLLRPCHVVTNDRQSTLYVSYGDGHKLVAYNLFTDEIMFSYKDKELETPTGADTDKDGNVYVCSYGAYCVHQLSPSGKRIKKIISKAKEKQMPLSIKFLKTMNRFAISFGGCDLIEIYDMSE
ncbi:hypothetical protein CHS0354_032710 [Potamilus streckersoni]|uniref:B box-type domain-containing protein n=1 Tax=Potamilus streckersoni TaxID=2493646 RepID=A0AAE0RQU9_9BIVA|nr:hypothetical protein CHS0354_032710 [Potamilus streckersoni]